MEILVGTLIALVAVEALGLAGLFRAADRERREWSAERRELNNRIMARNYDEFVHNVTATTVEMPQMTTDEAEAAWHETNKAKHPDLYPDDAE